MSNEKKLPLVKKALTMLANEMNENDRISLVTYASSAGVRLPSTSGEYKSEIISAIHNLKAGGSTNGEGGIHLAYTEAIRNFMEDGTNRVILCTDVYVHRVFQGEKYEKRIEQRTVRKRN
jgi:Ca-activated chloride channel family protein